MLSFFSYNQQNLTAYSPYGLPLSDRQGEERYLYGGKELDRTDGLLLYLLEIFWALNKTTKDFEKRQK